MSDARLQTLARAYHESGAPEDGAAWLRERMRRGDRGPVACGDCGGSGDAEFPVAVDHYTGAVEYEQDDCAPCEGTGLAPFRRAVELAAYCGDAAARLAVSRSEEAWGRSSGWPLSEWLRGLAGWPGAEERAALAAANYGLSPARVDARAWRDDPTVACAVAALVAGGSEVDELCWRAYAAAQADPGSLHYALLALSMRRTQRNVTSWSTLTSQFVRQCGGEQPVREAIQRALIAWALA